MFRVIPVATRTGKPLMPFLHVESFQAPASLTTPGAGSFVINVRDQRRPISAREVARLSKGWATTLVLEWADGPEDRVIEHAGMVTDTAWDAATGKLTINTVEIAKILEMRTLWSTGEENQGHRLVSGQTLGDVIREVLWWAAGRSQHNPWGLPVILGDLRPGNVSRPQFWWNYEPASVILDGLASEEGCPDWVLRPEWVDGLLRWRLELGSPYLSAGRIRIPVATPDSPVKTPLQGLAPRVDFMPQRTGVFALGAGSEADMRVGEAGAGQVDVVDQQVPTLMGSVSVKNIDDRAQLDSIARETLRAEFAGVEQWDFSLQLEPQGWIRPGMIRAGTRLLLDHPGDEFTPRGRYEQYVLEVRPSSSLLYQVSTQRVKR